MGGLRLSVRFSYLGKKYSLQELSEISGIKVSSLTTRLRRGWSVARAVETPVVQPLWSNSENANSDKVLIYFDEPIAGVFESMQPRLHTPYMAEKSSNCKRRFDFREYYIIHLENGKPLVVYLGEFRFCAGDNGLCLD